MSGAAIGTGPENGVVNDAGEAFGYRNLRVLDGSIIPGNLGVNPSLTITALSEYAMSRVPEFDTARASKIRPIRFSTPLAAQVSPLRAEGELLRQVLETTRFLYLFCRT